MELMDDLDEAADLMAPRGGGLAKLLCWTAIALAVAALVLLFGCGP